MRDEPPGSDATAGMLAREFFTERGLFAINNFLDASDCRALCAEVQAAATAPALTGNRGGDFVVDAGRRRAACAVVSAATAARVTSALGGIAHLLERHFCVGLGGIETPQFLAYEPGGFYRAHRDSSAEPNAPLHVRARQVSAVVFLNGVCKRGNAPASSSLEIPCYEGGELVFHDLVDNPRFAQWPLPLQGETGLLVAFPSWVMHEVLPVTRGRRFTIAAWYTW